MKFCLFIAALIVLSMPVPSSAQVEITDDMDLLVEMPVTLAPAEVPGVYEAHNITRGLVCYSEVEAERLAQEADRNRRSQYQERLNAPAPPCVDLRTYNLQFPIMPTATVQTSFEVPVGRGCLRQTIHVQDTWIEYWTVVCVTLPRPE